AFVPRTLSQMAWFSRRGLMRSGCEKLPADDHAAIGAFDWFLAHRETSGGRASNGARLAVDEKAAVMGVAVASNSVSGGTPRISSIVRRADAVEYNVESTLPVWV